MEKKFGGTSKKKFGLLKCFQEVLLINILKEEKYSHIKEELNLG